MTNFTKISFDDRLIDALRNAKRISVLTGAGISAESGIPTFRDAQKGLWANYNPEELASPEGFLRNPELVWNWYAWRREIIAKADPNPGHHALVTLARIVPNVTLITQNVDGLHQLAGSRDVIELHGNIHRNRCSVENTLIEGVLSNSTKPPLCPRCRAFLRPDVVWFGESLAEENIERAVEASSSCDIFISVGTSGLVHPAASLPFIALDRKAVIVEINPDSTPLSTFSTYTIHGLAGKVLPALLEAAWPEKGCD